MERLDADADSPTPAADRGRDAPKRSAATADLAGQVSELHQ
jgi:hypothetical protein